MKKIIFYLFLYIGIIGGFFKPALAVDDFHFDDKEIIDVYDKHYKVENIADDEVYVEDEKTKPLITADNEFIKLLIIPFFIDKLYPGEKINDDINPVMQRIYPTTNPERIEIVSHWVKLAVSLKRRYDYVVNKLKHNIEVARLMPKDAPIIAKDGEFASVDDDLQKESVEGEYNVSYQPFKYLEYDPGDTGEPVRRRDKNYEKVEQSLLDEIMLAMFRFDIPGFYRGLRKIPAYNDGSREKTVDAGNGVKARILLAENDLGDDDTVLGVFDIMVPKGYYINGDYLNDNGRPQFILTEDNNNSNISEYEVYTPAPFGVVKNGKSRRILVGQVPVPVRFKRADVKKGIYITGKLAFQLCNADGQCKPVVSEHSLKLRKTKDETASLHYNYVTQAFARLPRLKTKNAEFVNVEFDKKNNKLIANFNTDKIFSSVSAMAEDSIGTSYINPRYIIENNRVSAIFDISDNITASQLADLKDNQIAVTATFNEREVLRGIYDLKTGINNEQSISFMNKNISLWLVFVFGLLLNLMPGIFNLFVKLVECMWISEKRVKIFIRYCCSLALAWLILGLMYANSSWNVMFLNVWLGVLAISVVLAHFIENLGFMDMGVFRPLNKYLPKGYVTGFMSVVLISAFPMYLQNEVMSVVLKSGSDMFKYLLGIWCGMISLPLLLLVVGRYRVIPLIGLASFNVLYNLIYLIGAIWLIFSFRGWWALFIITLAIVLCSMLWYAYPFTIAEALNNIRSKKREKELFFRVQNDFSKMFCIIYIVCCALVIYCKPVVSKAVVVDEVIEQAKSLTTDDNPILVVIEGAWSPATLINRIKSINLANSGVKIIRFAHVGENRIIDEWLERYGKNYAPLNILFTRRYAKGLALPVYLNDTDWNKVTKDFNNI